MLVQKRIDSGEFVPEHIHWYVAVLISLLTQIFHYPVYFVVLQTLPGLGLLQELHQLLTLVLVLPALCQVLPIPTHFELLLFSFLLLLQPFQVSV